MEDVHRVVKQRKDTGADRRDVRCPLQWELSWVFHPVYIEKHFDIWGPY